MGAWSVDVFGGDTPLDVLGEIGDVIGEANLYPVDDLSVLVMNRLRTKLNLRERDIEAHFAAKRQYDPRDYFPVWAALTMASGGMLSSTLRASAAEAADENARQAENDGWRDPAERASYMTNLASMIRSYRPGDKVNFGHKGLFQTIAEGEASRRDS